MESTCSNCIPEYRCSCSNLEFCKHMISNHKNPKCSPQHCYNWNTIKDYYLEKSKFRTNYLTQLIEKLEIKLRDSENLSEDTLKTILGLCKLKIRIKVKEIKNQLNLYFINNLKLHSFYPVTEEETDLNISLGSKSYSSICIYSNKVFFVGGSNLTNLKGSKKVIVLNSKTGKLELQYKLQVGCYRSACAALQKKLFIIGGKQKPDLWVNLVQVVNLLNGSVTSHLFQCSVVSVCCTVLNQKIYFNSEDNTLTIINSLCTKLGSYKPRTTYGKILGLSSSEQNLFICMNSEILIMQESLTNQGRLDCVSLVRVDLALEWLSQSPVFYNESLYFLDPLDNSFFYFSISTDSQSSVPDSYTSQSSQPELNEVSQGHSQFFSIPSSSQVSISYPYSDSILNLSSAEYST